MRLASWPRQPRGLHVLSGQGQDGNAHAPFDQPSRYQHRDPSVVTPAPVLDAGTSASLVPVRCPRVVSGVHHGRHDRTGFRTPPALVGSSRTPSTAPGTPRRNRERHGQGTDERHGRRSDILDRHDHKAARRDTPSPPPVGPAFAAWQPRSARRWQDCQRDRNHGSDRPLLGVALPSKPRLGALLSSDDYGSSVERTAKRHPLWRGGWMASAWMADA
jgi:hypothetical protein